MIINSGAFYDKHHAMCVDQRLLAYTRGAQPLGARPLKEFEVIRIKHHATSVGVFVVDANVPVEIGFYINDLLDIIRHAGFKWFQSACASWFALAIALDAQR